MGQAKARGTLQQRIEQAQALQREEEPINVPCKTCNKTLNGFTLVEHGPAGAAWQKTCECGAITTALVQAKDSPLVRTFRSTLGMSKHLVGSDKKVSVTFLEKGLDTIETGLIRLG